MNDITTELYTNACEGAFLQSFEGIEGKYIFEHFSDEVDEIGAMSNEKTADQTLISLYANINGIGKSWSDSTYNTVIKTT